MDKKLKNLLRMADEWIDTYKCEFIAELQKLFNDITGQNSQPFVMGGGIYARVIPNAISFGPGMATRQKISDFLPAGHGGCHGKDEAVVMEKAYNCARIYIAAIVMLDEMID